MSVFCRAGEAIAASRGTLARLASVEFTDNEVKLTGEVQDVVEHPGFSWGKEVRFRSKHRTDHFWESAGCALGPIARVPQKVHV